MVEPLQPIMGDVAARVEEDVAQDDPALWAEATGYGDAQQGIPQSPSGLDPAYQPEYSEGYSEGLADKEAEVMSQPYGGPSVGQWSPEQDAQARQQEADREAEIRRVFGDKKGMGRAIQTKEGQPPGQETVPEGETEPELELE